MTRTVVLTAALAALALPALAQTDAQAKRRHVLPHVADGDGWRSSVLVTNVAESAAVCTVEMHGLDVDRFHAVDGVTAAGSTASFTLAERGGSLVWESRNDRAAASGYAAVDCSAPVTAQVVFAWIGDEGRPEGIATVFSSQDGREFQFPVLTPAGTLGFAVANDTRLDAECRVVLEDPRRERLGEASIAVLARSNRARMLHRIVAIPDGFRGGSATLTCDRRVAAIGLHFELEPDGEIVTFNTLPPALLPTSGLGAPDERAKRRHVLPHLADGDGWRSFLLVTNTNRTTSRCALELRGLGADRFQSVDGVTATGSTAEFELEGEGGYRVWGTRNRGPLASGYAVLDCTGSVVAQVVFAWLGEVGRPVGMATVFSSQDGQLFRIPVLTAAGTVGFSIANDGDEDAACRIVLEGPDGTDLGASSIAVPSKANRARMLHEAVGIPEGFGRGAARLACDRAVAVIGLHMELEADGGIATFNTLPPSRIEPVLPGVRMWASPTTIDLGGTTELSWTFTNAVRAVITPDVGGVAGRGSVEVSPRETTTYRITATTADGLTAAATVTIYVRFSERGVLEVLYQDTGGAVWLNQGNWLSDRPLGQWHGVEVDTAGRVIALRLQRNDLTGAIPPELGRLTELRRLWLFENKLTGPLPPELGSLAKLENLHLSSNRLTGALPPELGALGRLENLQLNQNRLTGAIPTEWGGLRSLTALWLLNNDLYGPIPAELGSLTRLRELWLSGNRLSGSIPPELFTLPRLTNLSVSANRLTGRIPTGLRRLASLQRLNLAGNDLSGSIPADLGNLYQLRSLYLGGNDLTGRIPGGLGRLRDLMILHISNNRLTGSIPPELGRLSSLSLLNVSENRLTGPLPPELASIDGLEILRVEHNELTGAFPDEFLSLGRMRGLSFDQNDGLCVPPTDDFMRWLEPIRVQGEVEYCDDAAGATPAAPPPETDVEEAPGQ